MWKVNYNEAGNILNSGNTGSVEYQVIRFVERVTKLSEHLNKNKHDNCAELSLRKVINYTKRLLKYLERTDVERYNKLNKMLAEK